MVITNRTKDPNAIHGNIAGEIATITEKATPVSADVLFIEDSEDSNNKKRVQVGNLPSGGGYTEPHFYDITESPYNAVAGGADISTALLSAFNDAKAAGGGVVFLPYDDQPYNQTTAIDIEDADNITFLSRGATIKAPTNYDSVGNTDLIRFRDCDDLVIDGIVFDQSWDLTSVDNDGAGRFLAVKRKSHKVTIKNCEFKNCIYTPLVVTTEGQTADLATTTDTADARFTLHNCRFTDIQRSSLNTLGGGIRAFVVSNCHFLRAGGIKSDGQRFDGETTIFPSRPGSFVAYGNTFVDCPMDSFQVEEGSQGAAILGNVWQDCSGHVLKIANGQTDQLVDNIMFANNVITNHTTERIIFAEIITATTAVEAKNILIHGNTVQTTEQSFVHLRTNSTSTVNGFVISDNVIMDWATGGTGTGFQEAIRISDVAGNDFGTITNLAIDNNKFYRVSASARDHDAIRIDAQAAEGDTIYINNNIFKGDALGEEVCRFEEGLTLSMNGNHWEYGEVEIRDTCTAYINGGSLIDARFAIDTNAIVEIDNVRFTSPNSGTTNQNYYVRCTNNTTVKIGWGVVFEGITDPIFESGGGATVTAIHYGTTANRPANPIPGQIYFDSTVGHLVGYDGSNWVDGTGTTV